MTSSEAKQQKRPLEGDIVLGGGYTEPEWAVRAAVARMRFPDKPRIIPVAFRWAMQNPEKFAALLVGKRFLGNSASAAALAQARNYSPNPGLGLLEAVMVGGVEKVRYDELFIGYGKLAIHQTVSAVRGRGTAEGRANGQLVRAKAGELGRHPGELGRLGVLHDTSSMEVLTSLGEAGVPVTAGYMEADEFDFTAPEGEVLARFERAGGVALKLALRGHERLLTAPEDILPTMYPHLPWAGNN
jgi:hypothetical protein